MTREEYYAGIEAYKNKLEHRAIDANAEDTAGKALENWKNQYLNQAINLRAKQYLASKFGRTDDASTYEKQLQILLDKMTNLKGVSLSAKQALMQTIDQTATNKANVQIAKHSDEPDGVLEHGGEWKKHKYIRIENGRYIYPEDLKKGKTKSDPNEVKEQYHDTKARYYDYYAKRGQDAVQFFGSSASNKTEPAFEADKEAFALGKRMAEEGARESAISRAQASGMRRTNALKEGQAKNEEYQAKKESFTKETADVAKANEERKERAVDNNNQSVQTARSQSDESAAKAQKEGEAMQAWKNQQEAKRKEYEADIKKMASESISAWASGEDDNNGGKYAAKVNEIGNKYVWDKSITADKMISDYANAVYEEYLKKKDSLSPEVRIRIENALSNIEDKYKPKKVTHSFDLSTKEGYYAAIEEYKRKRSI